MSHASGCVRFDDGAIKWTIYDGSSDVMLPRLFDTPMGPWDALRAGGDLWLVVEGEGEHVLIYSDYGHGFWWEGTAGRDGIIGPLEPWDPDVEQHDGQPEWVRFKAEITWHPMHSGPAAKEEP